MLLLLLDWDETLTNKDTLSLIAPASPPTPSSSLPSSPRFSTLSKFYMEDLNSHTANEQTPTTLRDQLRYLDSIDKVELKSQERVEQSGLFANFSPELLEKRVESRDLTFRNGWASNDADEQLSASQWIQNKSKLGHLELHIISVGWSARFISLGLKSKKGGSFPPHVPKSIIANEIQIGEDGKGTGKMTKSNDAELERFESIDLSEEEKQAPSSSTNFSGIRTGIHKLRELKRLRKDKLKALNEKEKNELLTVYVGDSNTDLPCLLAANVGIIIGESKSLIQTVERLDLQTYLSIGVEEWKSKRTQESKVEEFKSTGSEVSEGETKKGGEIWEEILEKERRSRRNEGDGFNLVKVKDWSEGLEVLRILAGEK